MGRRADSLSPWCGRYTFSITDSMAGCRQGLVERPGAGRGGHATEIPSVAQPSGFAVPARERCYYGAGRDLEEVVKTHLFGITLNHAGSSFLDKAALTSRAVWGLPGEGQFSLGYRGPRLGRGDLAGAMKIWAARRHWRDALTDPNAYDWSRTRKAWYFVARARDPEASVFFTKSPPHLLVVDQLARHFPNAKFLFLVRNPYAVCEGICRHLERRGCGLHDGSLPELAARHVVTCLEVQRRNIEVHRDRGIFFSYERMCAEPEGVAADISALVPELDDLQFRQRLRVKGRYHEMLIDMNERQLARLLPRRIAAFNRVFGPYEELLGHFGYQLMGSDGTTR